jgi:hypothetical protein
MPRYSAGARSAGAGSTTLPVGSLYASASVAPKIREIGIFNTTATAVAVKLVRLSSAGTQGAALTKAKHDPDAAAAAADARDTHTANPTLGDDLGYRTVLGAAVGAGLIWTFGDSGLRIPTGTGNGIGIIVATGTGQVVDFYIVWDE